MKTCPNCQTKATGNFCPMCGYNLESVSEFTPPLKRKGKVSAVFRLIILALFAILGVLALTAGAFPETNSTLASTIFSSGMIFLFGVWFWGLMKWCVFVIPRTFRAAKSFLTSIIPLTFMALVVEIAFGIWLTLIPAMIYCFTLMPMYSLLSFFLDNQDNILFALILFVVSVLLWILVAWIDYRKVTAKNNTPAPTPMVVTSL